MNHPRCVYINNRCRYQSITQQYLKRCLIKDDSNYMFRPIAAIVRFLSESMLYRIGMFMSRWWDLNICDVCYMLLLRDTGWGVCDVRYPGVYISSMSARCCPMWVSSYCLSISDVHCWSAFAMGSLERRNIQNIELLSTYYPHAKSTLHTLKYKGFSSHYHLYGSQLTIARAILNNSLRRTTYL